MAKERDKEDAAAAKVRAQEAAEAEKEAQAKADYERKKKEQAAKETTAAVEAAEKGATEIKQAEDRTAAQRAAKLSKMRLPTRLRAWAARKGSTSRALARSRPILATQESMSILNAANKIYQVSNPSSGRSEAGAWPSGVANQGSPAKHRSVAAIPGSLSTAHAAKLGLTRVRHQDRLQ